MKKLSNVLVFLMFVFLLAYSTYAKDGQNTIGVTNSVLCETDIDGLKITRNSPVGWWYAESKSDRERRPLAISGIDQDAALNGIQLLIRYAEFPSAELALQGIEYHRRCVAAPFALGIWDGSALANIDGRTWYGEDEGSIGLLVLSKTTCLLVGCYTGGDVATRRKVCEQVALKIVEKIKNGGRVILPEEKTVPPAKASP